MRLNERDIQMFDALRKSELKKQLVEYIERLEGEVCDVRNWGDDDTPQSARQAAKALREFRGHLNTDVGSKPAEKNPYI